MKCERFFRSSAISYCDMRGGCGWCYRFSCVNLVVACSVIFLLLISTYFIFCLPFWLSAKTTTANEGRNTQFHLHGKSILSSSYLWFRKINQILISHCRKDASGKVEWMIKAEQWQSRPADTHRGWLMVLSLNLSKSFHNLVTSPKRGKTDWISHSP